MYKCKYCIEKEKTWDKGNSPIKCAFSKRDMSGKQRFSYDNWNCGTMDYLRDLAEDYVLWSDDNYGGLIGVDGEYVFLKWYKSRGCTEEVIDMSTMEYITLDKVYEIINKYEGKRTKI